jgi:hypothetical protein
MVAGDGDQYLVSDGTSKGMRGFFVRDENASLGTLCVTCQPGRLHPHRPVLRIVRRRPRQVTVSRTGGRWLALLNAGYKLRLNTGTGADAVLLAASAAEVA